MVTSDISWEDPVTILIPVSQNESLPVSRHVELWDSPYLLLKLRLNSLKQTSFSLTELCRLLTALELIL